MTSKGFTLIELMVCLVIIGIMLTLAIPKIVNRDINREVVENVVEDKEVDIHRELQKLTHRLEELLHKEKKNLAYVEELKKQLKEKETSCTETKQDGTVTSEYEELDFNY